MAKDTGNSKRTPRDPEDRAMGRARSCADKLVAVFADLETDLVGSGKVGSVDRHSAQQRLQRYVKDRCGVTVAIDAPPEPPVVVAKEPEDKPSE